MLDHLNIESVLADLPGVDSVDIRLDARPPSSGFVPDAEARIGIGGRRVHLVIEWLGDRRGMDRKLERVLAGWRRGSFPVIAASVLGPSLRRQIEDSGVGWIDGRGGIHLERSDPPFFFHVEPPSRGGAVEKRRVFSPVASGVVRVMLEAPKESLRIAPIRERMIVWKKPWPMAGDDGPSRGAVSRALQGLVEAGHVQRDAAGWRVDRPSELLDAWLSDQRSRKPLPVRNWFLPGSLPERLEAVRKVAAGLDVGVWMSGPCAAELVKPYMPANVVDAYVYPPMKASMIGAALGAVDSDEGANIRFVLPLNDWVLAGSGEVEGVPVVSRAQIIADLQPEGPRALDVADKLRLEWSL